MSALEALDVQHALQHAHGFRTGVVPGAADLDVWLQHGHACTTCHIRSELNLDCSGGRIVDLGLIYCPVDTFVCFAPT